MRRDLIPGLTLAFALGACASAAVRSDPVPPAEATEAAPASPTVVHLEDAPSAVAPPETARIQHLARGENAYLGRLTVAPGAGVPKHRDPTEEYIHVLEGRGEMFIDGVRFEVRPGTTVYMPAGAEVSFQNGDDELVALQVFAGPGPAQKYNAWRAP